MKRKIRKIVCFALVLISVLHQNGNMHVQAGQSAPESVWDLNTKKTGGDGKYSGSGTCNTVNLYSNYLFTGVSKMKLTVKNLSAEDDIDVKVYKENGFWDTCVSTVEVPGNGKTIWKISTKSSEKYYIKFCKPAKFTWSIVKGK